jgi:hypothetical protein
VKKIAECVGVGLEWVQPKAPKHAWELRAGKEVVATLRFRSALGSFATAESGDGCWTFKRVGFWQTRVTVRACDGDRDLAHFRNDTWSGGGTLELADGRRFRATTNLWQTDYRFVGDLGQPLVRFALSGALRLRAEVTLSAEGAHRPALPLLVLLGWYLAVMMHQDAGAAAAAASAAAAV